MLVGLRSGNHRRTAYAWGKLQSKNADFIVLNSLLDEGAGFGLDTNKITIFGEDGFEPAYEKKPKQQVARDIVDMVVNMLYAVDRSSFLSQTHRPRARLAGQELLANVSVLANRIRSQC